MVRSIQAGRPIEVEEEPTLADSLGGGIGLENRYTCPIDGYALLYPVEVDSESRPDIETDSDTVLVFREDRERAYPALVRDLLPAGSRANSMELEVPDDVTANQIIGLLQLPRGKVHLVLNELG